MAFSKFMKAVIFGAVVALASVGLAFHTAAQPFLPELETVEFRDSFKAGSVGNAVIFRVENTTAFAVQGLSLRPQLPVQYLVLEQIDPLSLDLEPGEVAKITAEFSVREDAEAGAEDVIGFYFEAQSGPDLPIPSYRLVATIEEGDAPEPEAACNSAVESGGDAGGGVSVDLGGFVGLAGFSWEMFDIKDQMNISVGGVQKTTGCVSGSGTIKIDIPPGAGQAVVEVVPNCEQTTGTAWEFTFECPLSSEVTADGSGNDITSADTDTESDDPDGGGAPVPLAPTAAGAPVSPASLPPAWQGPTGHSVAEAEDNDRVADATPLMVGDLASGVIDPRGDVDLYAVHLSHQGELKVEFLSAPVALDMAFRVLDARGNQISGWQYAPAKGAAYAGWVDIKTPGTYVIELRDSASDAAAQSPYRMRATFTPTADPAEPNDRIDEATPLGWNVALQANILPRGDVDMYAVNADHQGRLTVNFTTGPPELDMAWRVLDERGNQVSGWQNAPDDGQVFQAWADLPAPGLYHIEVRDGAGDARSATPYEMAASLNPTQDRGEPNNGIGTATGVAFDAPVLASILPRGDAYLYRIDIAHQGELTVTFADVPDALDMAYRVLDARGNQIWGWQNAPANGAPLSGWADLPAPGVYFVEVRDGSSDARSSASYRMVLGFSATADTGEPNSAVAEATPMLPGQPVEAAILPRGDVDLYRIDIAHQGELTVDFTDMPAALDMAFRVLDERGNQIWGWQSAPANGAAFSGWADLASPGVYIIEVRDGSSDARSAEAYTMTSSLAATADLAEPNNGVDTATPIALGAPVIASILPKGDNDKYRFDVLAAGDLRVNFSQSPANLNMAFRILDARGNQVQGWQSAPNDGAVFSALISLPDVGGYIIEVRDGSSDERSPEAYGFSLTAP